MERQELQNELQRALGHHQAGALQEAETIYRQILTQDPAQPDALHLLGVLAHQRGEHEQAVALIRQAVAAKPGVAEYYNSLGEALSACDQLDEAIRAYENACWLRPDYAEAYNNVGISLQRQRRTQAAIVAFEQAARAAPDFVAACFHLGNTLHEAGRPDEAVDAYQRALALAPDDAEIHNNLGIALTDNNRLDAAIAAYEQALALQPNFAEAHANRGMALLLMGRFEQGWPEYRWRFAGARRQGEHAPTGFSQPTWDGAHFAAKTLLVHAEQGLGDAIQFVRYLPSVKARGGRVLFACHSSLHRLFTGFAGIDALVDRPPFVSDLRIPLLDLPRLFGARLDTIPNETPYLQADPPLAETWRRRLSHDTYNIGLCWAGRPEHRNDRNRSLTLSAFAPLARVAGVKFHSLQKGAAASQALSPPTGMAFADQSGELHDLADTAALVAGLDLVITVDTVVAHLAGALAKPAWTLLPYAPDWRWLLARSDSPWYPTMRLFRQPRIGDWNTVMEGMAVELQAAIHRR